MIQINPEAFHPQLIPQYDLIRRLKLVSHHENAWVKPRFSQVLLSDCLAAVSHVFNRPSQVDLYASALDLSCLCGSHS